MPRAGGAGAGHRRPCESFRHAVAVRHELVVHPVLTDRDGSVSPGGTRAAANARMHLEPTPLPYPVQLRPRAVVADDDPRLRAILAELVRQEGYSVSEAESGEELLLRVVRSVASRSRGVGGVDLVVSDLWMPSCSGLDVLRRLREVRWMVPMLIVTGDVDPSLRSRVEALDGNLLLKPFTTAELHFAISRTLDRPGAR